MAPVSAVQVHPTKTATNAEELEEKDAEEVAEGYVGIGNSARMIFDIDDHASRMSSNDQFRRKICADMVYLFLISTLGFAAVFVPSWLYESSWLVDDPDVKEVAASHLFMTIPAVIALLWVTMNVAQGVTAVQHAQKSFAPRVTWLGICFSVIVFIVQARKAAIVIVETKRGMVEGYLWSLLGLVTVIVVCVSLEVVHLAVVSIANKRDQMLKQCKPVSKWRGLMENFCRFRKEEPDAAYTFGEKATSPIQVLCQIVWIYFALAKASAFALYFLYYTGMDIANNIVWVLLAGVASTLVVTLNLSSALRNLMPIALSNAFYLGEIISLTTPGGLPPDNPGKSLTGFVEGVTMTHIVLRDFRRKQTWITHDNFVKYNLSNWTRRPCRLIHISFTVSSTVKDATKVAQLAAFSRKWMDTHEKIDPSSYKKSVVVDVKNGVKLEAIFYPLPGVDSYPLRQAYIIALVKAAKRFGLPVVPNEMLTSFPDGEFGSEAREDEMDLADLLAHES